MVIYVGRPASGDDNTLLTHGSKSYEYHYPRVPRGKLLSKYSSAGGSVRCGPSREPRPRNVGTYYLEVVRVEQI